MKTKIIDWFKIFLDSPKVTLMLLALLFPAIGSHFIPESKPEVIETPKEPIIRTEVIEKIVMPPHEHLFKPYVTEEMTKHIKELH